MITAAAIAQDQQSTGRGIPVAFGVCVALVVVWYLLKALATRWPFAASVVRRLSPRTRRWHEWIISAPATFGYIAIFTASTIVQRTTPPQLVNLLTSVNSTSLSRLRLAPLSALADSAIWVADHGTGLAGYVAGFATVVAYAERRYGTPRIILICLAGHVFGTLLTARVELHAIQSGLAPPSLANSTDVGVSYIMVAGFAAAVLVMRRRWQVIGGLALAAGVIAPVFVSHTVWDLGHLLATLCGLAAAALTLLAAPARAVPRLLLPGTAPVPAREASRDGREDGSQGWKAGTGAGRGEGSATGRGDGRGTGREAGSDTGRGAGREAGSDTGREAGSGTGRGDRGGASRADSSGRGNRPRS